jgi:3',5'-cyclic-AMP phosphodiesterase
VTVGGTRTRPEVGLFAVEDRTVQLTWRRLAPGPVRVRIHDDDGRGRPVRPPVEVVTDGGAGAVVIDDLPAGRALRLDVGGRAMGGRSVVLRARTLDPPPGEELVRLATIGDLHLGTRTFGHLGTIAEVPHPAVAHPVRCARAAVDEAVGWGAARIVVKGDVTDFGQPHEWRSYADLVRQVPVPVDALPGNHDRAHAPGRPRLAAGDAAAAHGLTMADPVLVRDLPGVRVVLVDSTTGGRNRGALGHARDELLDAVAGADPAGSVLVALHHQLHRHALPEGWPIGIPHDESTRLLDALGALHGRVLVTSGHTHRHRRWDRAGVTATQVGSTKDYPGVWGGYAVHEGGLRQVVRRVSRPDCLTWTDHTRRAAFGVWRWVGPGRLGSRCFTIGGPTAGTDG